MEESDQVGMQATVNDGGKVLLLSGRLTFANAHEAYREFTRLLQEPIERVDCSGLEHADSTALALLLTGAGLVREKKRMLQIEGLNPRLHSLARVYGVESLLGLVPAGSKDNR